MAANNAKLANLRSNRDVIKHFFKKCYRAPESAGLERGGCVECQIF